MEYSFRQATGQDLGEVVSLYKKAIALMNENKIYQWDEIYPNEEVLSEDIMKGELYLLIKNKKIISGVVMNEDQDEAYLPAQWKHREGKIAVIHRLCVHPEAQGEGNGKRTMQFIEGLILNSGYSSIRLDTFSDNYVARSLYKQLGYSYVGDVTFRKGLFFLMEKAL